MGRADPCRRRRREPTEEEAWSAARLETRWIRALHVTDRLFDN